MGSYLYWRLSITCMQCHRDRPPILPDAYQLFGQACMLLSWAGVHRTTATLREPSTQVKMLHTPITECPVGFQGAGFICIGAPAHIGGPCHGDNGGVHLYASEYVSLHNHKYHMLGGSRRPCHLACHVWMYAAIMQLQVIFAFRPQLNHRLCDGVLRLPA